jgi:hypothetical protein
VVHKLFYLLVEKVGQIASSAVVQTRPTVADARVWATQRVVLFFVCSDCQTKSRIKRPKLSVQLLFFSLHGLVSGTVQTISRIKVCKMNNKATN